MKIEVNKNMLAGALVALGKLVCRTSPVEVYKSLRIEAKDGVLRFQTCSSEETLEFRVECEFEEEFSFIVNFDELRNAVKACKSKGVTFEVESELMIVDGKIMSPVYCEWPEVCVPNSENAVDLPEKFVEMLAQAAPIVNRTEVRRVLQGINLSRDGITVTNGKELFNIPCPLEIENLTIPFPLALLSAKPSASGRIFVWEDGANTLFRMDIQQWSWTAKALPGTYPNWKQIVPNRKVLNHVVSFLSERGQQLEIFLKNIPDDPPHNTVELYMTGREYLNVKTNGMNTSIEADSPFDWGDFSLMVNKNLLLRLLSLGHTKIECADSHMPFVATGGVGTYIAMPLFQKNESKIQPKQEEPKMENTEMKVVSAPMQTAAQNQETEAIANPMEDLSVSIESFKVKLKAIFDESNVLSRKVKEVQLAQKQKERDFIMAKRAIERIKMVSGF